MFHLVLEVEEVHYLNLFRPLSVLRVSSSPCPQIPIFGGRLFDMFMRKFSSRIKHNYQLVLHVVLCM